MKKILERNPVIQKEHWSQSTILLKKKLETNNVHTLKNL